jgi:hypothetical protein
MPQAIPFIAAAIADAAAAVGTFAFEASVAVGLSAEATAAIATIASTATTLFLTVAPSILLQVALAPKIPPPGAVQTPIKQGTPGRRSGYGRVRLSGPYMCFEAKGKFSYDVCAIHQGRIDAIEQFWLDDDEVEVDGYDGVLSPDGKKYAYGAGGGADARVKFHHRLGLPTETAYADIVTALNPLWTSNHRGDGTASIALVCQQSKPKYQQEDFPRGVPAPSVTARLAPIYDPRENGTESQGDPDNWHWTDNPALEILDYLTNGDLGFPGSDRGGMGLPFARHILPAMDDWIEAANTCDDLISLDAGGSEKRYRSGGLYDHAATPAEILGQLLTTCDGWLGIRPDGAFTLKVGKYSPPTVTLTDDHVVGYSFKHFTADEEAVNELAPTYTDPSSKFNTVDAGSWRDEADIAARGKIRSQTMPLPWVQSRTQGRRLAKRQMARYSAELRGTIKTILYGLKALGERYLRLRIAENISLRDLVVEVGGLELDLVNAGLTIDWVAVDPDTIDAWTPAAEEGDVTAPADRPDATSLDAPTTLAAAAIVALNAQQSGAQLTITGTTPGAIGDDVEWLGRYRRAGDTNWTEINFTDAGDGTGNLVSPVIPGSGDMEVQTAYRTAGGISTWSSTETVAVDVPGPADVSVQATEDIAAGDFTQVYSSAGATRVRLARADDPTKYANSFARAAIANGATGRVTLGSGLNDAVTVAAPAAEVYLSETVPGGYQTAVPSTDGHIRQVLGPAVPGVGIGFTARDPEKL